MKYLFWMVLVFAAFCGLAACDKEDGGSSGAGGGGGPIPVVLSITTVSLPVAEQGTAYSVTLQATGGTSPYFWGLLSSTLPPGLTIGLTTGTITGTPISSGVFSFTVRCQDSTTPFVQATQGLGLTVNAAASGPTGTFGNLTAYPAHIWPYGLAQADFDGDTLPDLAVANFRVNASPGNGAFSIITNTGSRTFSTPLVYLQPSSVEIREVITADLNNDTKPDLVVASYNSNEVQVYLNDGSGGFTAQTAVFVVGPSSVSAGDMTGDGIPDVVVGSDWPSAASRVIVCVNNGAGILTPATYVPLPGVTGQVFVKTCMFNVTAMPGVVAFDYSSSILYGMEATTGNPTWLTTPVANSLGAGGNPLDMALGDFDADGKIDVAVVNGLTPGTVTLMQGTGTANFTAIGSLTAGNFSTGIVAGDFDADGKPDLAVANANGNSVSVFLNDGGWVFQAGVSYAAGSGPFRIVVADFDDDGFLDLAFTNDPAAMTAGTVSILYGE